MLREMTDPQGGFFSAQDADSEGVEGKFFLWSRSQVVSELGEEEGSLFADFFDITERGNFEGSNIPNINKKAMTFAQEKGLPL